MGRSRRFSTGDRIGALTVVEVVSPDKQRPRYRYRVKCDCGEEKFSEKGNILQNGGRCTHLDRKNHPELNKGERYGCLTVVEKIGTEHSRNSKYIMRCDCGETKTMLKHCVLRRSERCTHQVVHKHYLYRTWRNIIRRCYDSKCRAYPNYGGRGIGVCDEWRNSFAQFLADMGDRPEGHSIDRINNSSGYSPENCRWASDSEQARNKRNTLMLVIDSVCKSVADWCEETGVPASIAKGRIYSGWDTHMAVTTPVRMSRRDVERLAYA